MVMATVADVATEIRERIPGVGKIKLHKLLYYCQGYHLAMQGQVLFPESISAWNKGPVVGTFWHEEEEHGLRPGDTSALTDRELNSIGFVLSRYGRFTGSQLVDMTHDEPPYQRADAHRAKGKPVPMSRDEIRRYFRTVLEKQRSVVDEDELMVFLAGAVRREEEPVRQDSVEEIRRLAVGA